jgi:hypothetical protein
MGGSNQRRKKWEREGQNGMGNNKKGRKKCKTINWTNVIPLDFNCYV